MPPYNATRELQIYIQFTAVHKAALSSSEFWPLVGFCQIIWHAITETLPPYYPAPQAADPISLDMLVVYFAGLHGMSRRKAKEISMNFYTLSLVYLQQQIKDLKKPYS